GERPPGLVVRAGLEEDLAPLESVLTRLPGGGGQDLGIGLRLSVGGPRVLRIQAQDVLELRLGLRALAGLEKLLALGELSLDPLRPRLRLVARRDLGLDLVDAFQDVAPGGGVEPLGRRLGFEEDGERTLELAL